MTIWFSTNIPEMRAISVFNRVSTDISEIQQRFATGQRINSGRDDPGGLIVREGLRADIKGIQGLQSGMVQAENLTSIAAGGMMQLLELLIGSDVLDSSRGGLIGAMSGTDEVSNQAIAKDFLAAYDSIVAGTTYNGDKLIGGDLKGSDAKIYQLGGGGTLTIDLPDLSSAVDPIAYALANEINKTSGFSSAEVIRLGKELQAEIATEVGKLGGSQNVIALSQRALDSRLESFVGAEGRISNIDVAWESSRLARAELLAQNSMSSILYNRNYAAFSVRSLFG